MSISPQQLRDLAARAEALATEVRALCDSAPAAAAERDPLQAARHAAGWLDRGGEDLQRAAGDLARIRSLLERRCGIPWGVCPEHGNTLSYSVNVTTCRVCGRTWERDRRGQPCQERVTWKVTDRAGTVTTMCDGHVLGARATTQGATFTRLDAELSQP
ncbi:hypothetical protein AB0M50_53685 [Nonomuraea fuscirosea]|uniref:Uncharacterized protein n=1 Tax=Nonomuraea fuscirosea TaxID=1291556 RepID=A0A2T0N4S0_9ACTN|nr:hypothetical protein [Nonomuraea fuscirosea]PRX67343.1 hypothetical protein B0I32_10499 [Nonomuraea fuscirosea]WSA57643.1 hypothetical protein OIE67_24385 [Nonomuraea fuscirosea]